MSQIQTPRLMQTLLLSGAFLCLAATIAPLAFSAEPVVTNSGDCECGPVRVTMSAWRHENTANFQIWIPSSQDAERLSKTCEEQLERLRKTWQPEAKGESWQGQCVVVVHGNLTTYQRAIGNSRDRSVGMATYTVEKGKIASRRIDLRSDADGWMTDALPHEMTPLVFADAVGARPLPRWLDEGSAVLAESPAKQARREVEFNRAVLARNTIPTLELLTLAGIPAPRQRDVFYSQSASLAAFLIERDGPETFLEFARQTLQRGPDSALRNVYRINGAGHLDQLWKADTLTHRSTVRTLEQLVDVR